MITIARQEAKGAWYRQWLLLVSLDESRLDTTDTAQSEPASSLRDAQLVGDFR